MLCCHRERARGSYTDIIRLHYNVCCPSHHQHLSSLLKHLPLRPLHHTISPHYPSMQPIRVKFMLQLYVRPAHFFAWIPRDHGAQAFLQRSDRSPCTSCPSSASQFFPKLLPTPPKLPTLCVISLDSRADFIYEMLFYFCDSPILRFGRSLLLFLLSCRSIK